MIPGFSSGFMLGIYFVSACLVIFLAVVLFIENRRKDKFLVEISSFEEYIRWKSNGGKK